MSTSAPPARSRLQTLIRPSFNVQMAFAGTAILIVSILGCLLTSIHVPDAGTIALGLALALVVVLPLLLFLQEKGMLYLRDSLLTILWAFFFMFMLGYPVTVAARLGMGIELKDLHFKLWDRWLGVYVPSIEAWASSHWLGIQVNKTYTMLFPFMRIAILLPIVAGKLKYAQKFVTANLVAFALGLPVTSLLPGIAPWFGDHFTATPDLAMRQSFVLLAIRHPGPYIYQYPAGAICFPSFHVVWAVLCVYALWGFRPLRIPASLFSTLIVFSTLTTGSHYLCDVLAGMVLVAITIVITERLNRDPSRRVPDSIDIAEPASSG